ncbi:MAG TPA: cytochrome c biogenesis protein CcdA, partial [Gemmatimonadaceae bacterium]|nr:cytochrome c biogenesis protein CcdA [Gemmatimonadaceae bacterium]
MTSGFFWLAATTGLLSLLTPCVFPMVPVTIAYFSAPLGQRAASLRRPLLFGLGIIATFTLLGLVLASIFGAAGLNRFAADPSVNLVLAVLFAIFAANLFGWFAAPLPWRLVNAADRAARDATPGSSLGALVMGATFTLTSVTCTAPFVGTLLVLAAKGSWAMPVLGMLVYSAFFALPFVLLALVPSALSKLPRAGEWMATIRVLIGLLEVGAAVKFLSNADLVRGWGVVTRNVVLVTWAALAVIGAIYLGRLALAKRQRGEGDVVALAPIAATLLVAAWLLSGLNGTVLPQIEAFLPPAVNHVPRTGSSLSPTWMLNDYPRAQAVAKSSGKAVFIDFTGYTCTNCRWMEANIFSRPDVGAALGKFVLSRLYTDGDGDLYQRQQEFQEKSFGTVALPLYAVVGPDGKVRATFSGLTRNPAEFIAFL